MSQDLKEEGINFGAGKNNQHCFKPFDDPVVIHIGITYLANEIDRRELDAISRIGTDRLARVSQQFRRLGYRRFLGGGR